MTDDEAKSRAREITSTLLMQMSSWPQMSNSERIVEVARFLSEQNISEPTNRNDGVPRFLFMSGDWVKEIDSGLAWCAGAALWVYRMAGSEVPGNQYKLRKCSRFADRCRELGAICDHPEPGALVFYRGRANSDPLDSRDVHHVEIVEMVGDTEISTLGGNIANRFGRAVHKLNDKTIFCYAKPWGILA